VTALAQERMRSYEKWTYHQFPLAVGNKAYKHAAVGIDLSTGKIEPAHAEADLLIIGVAAETIDATSVEKQLNVNLCTEIEVEWWASAGGISATNLGSLCYFSDDQTVTLTPNGALAGRIWSYDSTKGVAVQKLSGGTGGGTAAPFLNETAAVAFVSNDSIVAAEPASGALIDIPTTAAASTVTLPASAAEGTLLTFVADGTKNGHTVQYRDATGPTNLTTALTASKRHQVHAVFLNGKWTANAYVSP
jgi:hypothetical protein